MKKVMVTVLFLLASYGLYIVMTMDLGELSKALMWIIKALAGFAFLIATYVFCIIVLDKGIGGS